MKKQLFSRTFLTATAIIIAFSATPALAQINAAQGVPTRIETLEQPDIPAGVVPFNISDFNPTGDGALVKEAVGDQLFKMYDVDGNGVVDNIEYERRALATVVPVKKVTTVSYDVTGDGVADQKESNEERLMRETLLSKFDDRKLGLSANELLDRSFRGSDIDGNKFISRKEWKGAYNAAIDRSNRIQGNLNR